MQTMLRGKVTLLLLAFGMLLAFAGVAFAQDSTVSTPAAPTIQSDLPDYAPGQLVTLTGGGWQPGESVNINVNDDAGQTWNRNVNVIADLSGNISDSFNLPDWFVATYSVTAAGAQSGVATTSFTDGNVQVRATDGSNALGVTFPVGSVDRFNNTGCTGTGSPPAPGAPPSPATPRSPTTWPARFTRTSAFRRHSTE
jgi:hypothetical protein